MKLTICNISSINTKIVAKLWLLQTNVELKMLIFATNFGFGKTEGFAERTVKRTELSFNWVSYKLFKLCLIIAEEVPLKTGCKGRTYLTTIPLSYVVALPPPPPAKQAVKMYRTFLHLYVYVLALCPKFRLKVYAWSDL